MERRPRNTPLSRRVISSERFDKSPIFDDRLPISDRADTGLPDMSGWQPVVEEQFELGNSPNSAAFTIIKPTVIALCLAAGWSNIAL
jgi:hypothetical protein